jgi:hypothetical protein
LINQETPNALEVGFSGDGKDIAYVSILGKNWASKSGLRLGAGRAVLERLNGGPFRFYGTGFDYSGLIQESGPALKRYTVHVRPIPKAGRPAEYFMGEKLFSSRDPALQDVEVYIIQVNLGATPD